LGLNAVREALENRPGDLERLFIQEGRRASPRLAEVLALAQAQGLAPLERPASFFQRFAPGATQGVAAFLRERKPLSLEEALAKAPAGPTLLLALDHVTDAGNFGALIRSAAAFGLGAVIFPKDRQAPLSPQVLKAASGGAEKAPLVQVVNLASALDALRAKGYWLIGADGAGRETLPDFQFPRESVLALGSEGRGLSPLIAGKMDFTVRIPLLGGMESLNVSVAGAVFMYAFRAFFPAP
jgi:23S rRNA (guanosine2251-2'-O)-methyltransferase